MAKELIKKGGYYLFLCFLFIAPLNQGLFYEKQFYPLAIVLAILALIFIYQTKHKFSYPEVGLLLLTLIYFVSFLKAASPHAAYLGFLKYVFYYLALVLTNCLVKDKQAILLVMISAVSLGTLAVIFSQAQIIETTGLIIGGRFSSTFHYPNTYAAVLAAMVPLIISLLIKSKQRVFKQVLLFFLFLHTTAFYAALSRGALLVYLPALLLLIIWVAKEYKPLIYNLILINGLGLLSANFIMAHPGIKTILVLLLGGGVVLLFDWWQEKRSFPLGILITLILITVLFTQGTTLTQLSRLKNISWGTSSVASRLYFFEDAFLLFKKHWLIGCGAGGWEALYRTIQGHLYDSTEVHNGVLQIMVESGLLGVSLFLSLFLFLLGQQVWHQRKKIGTLEEKLILLAIFIIFFHSLLDFDLTVTAVPLYLFVLIGLLGGKLKCPGRQFFKGISLFLAFILLISACSFYGAHLIAQGAIKELNKNKVLSRAEIIKYEGDLTWARKLAPLAPLYPAYLGQLKIVKGEIEAGLVILDEVISLEPYKYKSYLTKASALVQLQQREAAIPYFEKIITLMPKQHTGYEFALENYVQLALKTGKHDYLVLAQEVYLRAEKQMQSVKPKRLPYWQQEKLTESAFTNFYAGVAAGLAADYYQAEEFFTQALKKAKGDAREEIKVWQAVVREKRGLPRGSKVPEEKAVEICGLIQDFVIKSEGK